MRKHFVRKDFKPMDTPDERPEKMWSRMRLQVVDNVMVEFVKMSHMLF
jgi:hypothetical protein